QAYPPPGAVPPERAFAHPFPADAKGGPILWRERYRMLLNPKTLEVDTTKFRHLVERPDAQAVLLEALEWQHLTQYLAEDVYQGEPARHPPLVLALMDRDDPDDGDPMRIGWALTPPPGRKNA